MSNKRPPTSELNHKNWDEEVEPEEPGVFQRGSDEVLEKRVLKIPRRRLPRRDGTQTSTIDVFSKLKGLSAPPTTNPSPFSFLANIKPTPSQSLTLPTNTSTSTTSTSNGATKNTENGAKKKEEALETPATSNVFPAKSEKQEDTGSKRPVEYFAKLKGLNESVAEWIKTHVDANPFCILTPIFRDYEKYLKDIEAKHGQESEKTTKATESSETSNTSQGTEENKSVEKKTDNSAFESSPPKPLAGGDWKPDKSMFGNINSNVKSIFGNTEQSSETPKSVFGNSEQGADKAKSIFGNLDKSKSVFGNVNSWKRPFASESSSIVENKSEEKSPKAEHSFTPATGPYFSFGQSSSTSNASAGFSFGSAKPFSFSAQAVKPQESEEKGSNEEDEEPPKPDFKPVVEPGALYQQRCKVFVKKDNKFEERSVGMLYLKATQIGKTQLIVRAETCLGNLLLNTLLTESTPVQRMNHNTIMLICLPTSDDPPPPVPVLLRVKTAADADVLLENLNKYKK